MLFDSVQKRDIRTACVRQNGFVAVENTGVAFCNHFLVSFYVTKSAGTARAFGKVSSLEAFQKIIGIAFVDIFILRADKNPFDTGIFFFQLRNRKIAQVVKAAAAAEQKNIRAVSDLSFNRNRQPIKNGFGFFYNIMTDKTAGFQFPPNLILIAI